MLPLAEPKQMNPLRTVSKRPPIGMQRTSMVQEAREVPSLPLEGEDGLAVKGLRTSEWKRGEGGFVSEGSELSSERGDRVLVGLE